MASDLTALAVTIKDLVRWQRLDLTEATSLERLNRQYRWLATLSSFPEFRRQDTTRSTVADTETITKPVLLFTDIRIIEIQDPDDGDKYKNIPKARDELEWGLMATESNGWPLMWLDGHDGSNHQINFRPIPNFAKTVRVTGYIQPAPLVNTGGSDTTAFRTLDMDDALANLFAGDLLMRRDQQGLAQVRFSSAQQTIQRVTGKEITIAELALAASTDTA